MSDIKLGQLIEGTAQRDAIHIAIAPVVAGLLMIPGEHVGVTSDGLAFPTISPKVGIVDPFLSKPVKEGEQCWVLLYQQTITGMRHHWAHPAFDATPTTPPQPDKDPIARLRVIAAACDMGYDMMMQAAEMWLHYEDYTVQQGLESWRDSFPAFTDEFWALYEKVKGVTVPDEKRQSFFSCSC